MCNFYTNETNANNNSNFFVHKKDKNIYFYWINVHFYGVDIFQRGIQTGYTLKMMMVIFDVNLIWKNLSAVVE